MKTPNPLAWSLILLLLLAGIGGTGCGSDSGNQTDQDTLSADTVKKDTAQPKPEIKVQKAESKFTPILRVPLEPNVNVIYSVGFQLGWDQLRKQAGEKVRMNDAPELVQELNSAPGSYKDISQLNGIGVAGSPGFSVAQQFGFQFSQKFPEDDTLITELDSVRSAVVGYAYKNTAYGFRLPYYANALNVQGRMVDCFGIGSDGAGNNWGSWVTVHDYKNPDDWVVSITSDTLPDRLIIAQLQRPHPLLLRNIYDVEHRLDSNLTPGVKPGDRVVIPAFHFQTYQSYPEIEGKPLLNTYFNGLPIERNLHLFRIGLGYPGSASGFMPELNTSGRNMIVDGPFLLMVWEKDSPYPWLVMWIENNDLMWSSP